MLQSKVQVIPTTANRPSTRLGTVYTVHERFGYDPTIQENQLAAEILARYNIFSQMVPYMSIMYQYGAGAYIV